MSEVFGQGFWYVASPYSHPDKAVMQKRFEDVVAYVADRMLAGDVMYSPIAHNHVVAERHTLPTDWAFWRHIDGNMLVAAKGLQVLCLDGWEKSVGVQAEIAIAMSYDLLVEYVNVKGEQLDAA